TSVEALHELCEHVTPMFAAAELRSRHQSSRSTSFLNTSPRCSKLSNMSNEAQAGDSRTTSPGAATVRAFSTASWSDRQHVRRLAAEAPDGRADHRGRHAGPERAGGRREDVLHVVLAAQADLRQQADLLDVAVELRRDPAVADEDTVGQLALPAEPHHGRRRPG